MGITTGAHDPSARFAGTSPREAWGGMLYGFTSPSRSRM